MQQKILVPAIIDLTNKLSVRDSAEFTVFCVETCKGPHNVETMCSDSYASEPHYVDNDG